MNLGLSDILKAGFPDTKPVPRPAVEPKKKYQIRIGSLDSAMVRLVSLLIF
jgi:hypothetical protein